MYALLSGVALIGASLALVYRFIPREGAEVHRPGWMDTCIVIAAMAGLTLGAGLLISAIINLQSAGG